MHASRFLSHVWQKYNGKMSVCIYIFGFLRHGGLTALSFRDCPCLHQLLTARIAVVSPSRQVDRTPHLRDGLCVAEQRYNTTEVIAQTVPRPGDRLCCRQQPLHW